MATVKAVVFHGVDDIRVEEVPKPRPNAGEAVIRITATTICATLGARLRGASLIVGVNPLCDRRAMARRFGAGVTLDPTTDDVVSEIKRLTDGRGVDVAIEALGRQETFESALMSVRAGGVVSSVGVYSGKLVAPYEAIHAGLGDQRIVTTLCPGGNERMRRLMALVMKVAIYPAQVPVSSSQPRAASSVPGA